MLAINHRNASGDPLLDGKDTCYEEQQCHLCRKRNRADYRANVDPREELLVSCLTQLPGMIALTIVGAQERTDGDQRGRSLSRNEGVVFNNYPVSP